MNVVNKVFLTALLFCSIVYTISSIISFTKFLSDFSTKANNMSLTTTRSSLFGDSTEAVSHSVEALVVDISLLCIFIIFHSSLVPAQNILSSMLKLPVLNKMLYSLLTSVSLQLLMRWWMPIPEYTLWTVDTHEAKKLQVFFGIHVVSWILIYAMMISMDTTDLLGIKQVYCYMTGCQESKSEQLKRLHKKMRHPSFIGFMIIFWIYPCMSLDRLLLASVCSLYMLLAWRPDTFSYNYLVQQNVIKRSVL